LEKFSYDQSSIAEEALGSRLRLHVTIDRKFRERLARDKNRNRSLTMSSGFKTQLYQIGAEDCSRMSAEEFESELEAVQNGKMESDQSTWNIRSFNDRLCAVALSTLPGNVDDNLLEQSMLRADVTTPSDLGDLMTSDLLPFPAVDCWELFLDEINTDGDIMQFSDAFDSCDSIQLPSLTTDTVNSQHTIFTVADADSASIYWPTSTVNELFSPVELLSTNTCAVDDTLLVSNYLCQQEAVSTCVTHLFDDIWL